MSIFNFIDGNIGKFERYCFFKFRKRGFYLIAYFPAGKIDFVHAFRTCVNNRFEQFFHTERRATAVNISREWKQVFGTHHFDILFADGLSGFFEIEFTRNGGTTNT